MGKLKDFIGFSFNGHHSSEFGLYRVSSGSTFADDWSLTPSDNTVDIPGGDGQYFYNSTFKDRTIQIDVAFDNIKENDIRRIKQWLNKKDLGELVFDESPYQYYSAKINKNFQVKYMCFDEGTRTYKGNGSISFEAFCPYGISKINDINKYVYSVPLKSLNVKNNAVLKVLNNNLLLYTPKENEDTLIIDPSEFNIQGEYTIVTSGENLFDCEHESNNFFKEDKDLYKISFKPQYNKYEISLKGTSFLKIYAMSNGERLLICNRKDILTTRYIIDISGAKESIDEIIIFYYSEDYLCDYTAAELRDSLEIKYLQDKNNQLKYFSNISTLQKLEYDSHTGALFIEEDNGVDKITSNKIVLPIVKGQNNYYTLSKPIASGKNTISANIFNTQKNNTYEWINSSGLGAKSFTFKKQEDGYKVYNNGDIPIYPKIKYLKVEGTSNKESEFKIKIFGDKIAEYTIKIMKDNNLYNNIIYANKGEITLDGSTNSVSFKYIDNGKEVVMPCNFLIDQSFFEDSMVLPQCNKEFVLSLKRHSKDIVTDDVIVSNSNEYSLESTAYYY